MSTGRPYHVLQPALCQYIAKQILASYKSGATLLGHVNNGKNRNDDDTIVAFVCHLVGLVGNTTLAGATPGLAQTTVRSSLCSMVRCHNKHHNLRTPHIHRILGTAWARWHSCAGHVELEFFCGMLDALRRAHITHDSLQCPLLIHTYQRLARLWTACSRARGCGRRTSAHKAETHSMGVYLASSPV